MNKFNFKRFANFAKYDITINKPFYRNICLGTFAGVFGMMSCSFLMRWTEWKNMNMDVQDIIDSGNDWLLANQFDITPSAMIIGIFLLIMWTIFSGCWAHNLRNKQGRISEFTLPATNLEKFTWHITAMILGGALVCVLSLLLCDGINYLASYNLMSPHVTSSYTEKIIDAVFVTARDPQHKIIFSVPFIMACCMFGNLGLYAFGNSVKYKFNLILTYIASQVVGFLLFVFIMILAATGLNLDIEASPEQAKNIMLGGITAFSLLVGFGGFALSYFNYKNARITSLLNK